MDLAKGRNRERGGRYPWGTGEHVGGKSGGSCDNKDGEGGDMMFWGPEG